MGSSVASEHDSECQKPACSREATETFEGPYDNQVAVCEPCYWGLVTGESVRVEDIEPTPTPRDIPRGPIPEPSPPPGPNFRDGVDIPVRDGRDA